MKRKFIPTLTLQAIGLSVAAVALTVCATFIAMLVAGMLSSCEHKGFCDPVPAVSKVHVIFDWRKAPGATAKTMSLYLYPMDGGEVLRHDFDNALGGVVEIPRGSYKAICLNNDTENVLLQGTDSYDTFEVYTRSSRLLEPLGLQSAPNGANPSGEPVALAAERLWTGKETDIRIKPVHTSGSNAYDSEIILYPEPATCLYTVEVRNARNLKYVSALSFSLSGLSGNLLVAEGKLSSLRTILPFEGRGDENAATITGRVHGFGLSTADNKLRTLVLYVILTDKSRQYYTFDVSAQVNNAPDPRNVHIVIDGLTLPKPIAEGDGRFKPSVDEWIGEEVEIGM